MAVTQIASTTLTNAITAKDDTFVVGSTAGITAGVSGGAVNWLVFAGKGGVEVCKVQAVPVSGTVQVFRGQQGTKARAHTANTIIYYGTPDVFRNVRDNVAGVLGDSVQLPEYCLPGTRARDGAGNEYVMVDLQMTTYSGVTVLIDSAHDATYFAAVLVGGNQGFVGVMAEEGTSNQWAWAQIYGKTVAQDATATSAADSTYVPTAATSVSTPAAGMAAIAGTSAIAGTVFLIKGMFIDGAATSATTSATSHTGIQVPVTLNYPFVTVWPDVISS
jgi:hypothetical protein